MSAINDIVYDPSDDTLNWDYKDGEPVANVQISAAPQPSGTPIMIYDGDKDTTKTKTKLPPGTYNPKGRTEPPSGTWSAWDDFAEFIVP